MLVKVDLSGRLEPKPDRFSQFVSLLTVVVTAFAASWAARGIVATAEESKRQRQITLTGQLTDRFNKAIEQLGTPGADKLDMRLGGIYSLERIMRESEFDQSTIVEVLSAFVRNRTPARTAAPEKQDIDVEAAIRVLARRPERPDPSARGRVNLQATNLSGVQLSHADLRGTDCKLCKVNNAILWRINLSESELVAAEFTKATMNHAHLRNAQLFLADFAGTDLGESDLSEAVAIKAKFGTANLANAELIRVVLLDADLRGARLPDSDLSGAHLARADLRGADLTRARLAGANLTGARMAGAKLAGADLSGACGAPPITPVEHCPPLAPRVSDRVRQTLESF
ncbi:hypothetical protein GCM10010123_21270 [Pilimelia anulata]|uniref:Pentapeptide repeat-containing protein n=1 Tax=Pilimelia anulata TaxID=53371 RepID=A0A8J3B9M4_9ACTN|nr:pentapeptide repeat-containing protein [Pilimelia anulata]GGJ91233.1 hypothetical protein GCM10010123_21270 [Pilimelia anulata]